MNLDITFSDHRIEKQSLHDLGSVVAAIHRASDDQDLCFWTFIYYIAENHPSILGVNLDPELKVRCKALLSDVELPPVELAHKPKQSKSWWQFWK